MTVVSPSSEVRVDPVTFEVIRHRLWAINDEQGMVAARLSGSPIVYDSFDFNAGLLTADGQGVVAGIYIIAHAAPLHQFVHSILTDWSPQDIREGDMFFTNDPWAGALHANDGIMATPIFHDGELITWSGIVLHDMDVGSPIPGSFVVGAADRFGEAPLMPPVKIAENFELRGEIVRAYTRNHRSPEMTLLALRARLAALTTTHRRIHDLADEYGVDTVTETQRGIIDYVEGVVRARLRDIPDGSWSEQVYIDHDGVNDVLYPVVVKLTKIGDRLIADFNGTSRQAPGGINCTRAGLEGGLFGIFLLFMCFDLPWSVGALRRIVEIRSEAGSLVDAEGAAAVSMASIMGTSAVVEVVHGAFAKMLLCSRDPELRSEAQAPWGSTLNGVIIAGDDRDGHHFANPIGDSLGPGTGALAARDGIDSGGIVQSLSASVGNVEVAEGRFPVLQLYRRERADSAGSGRMRGGCGLEAAVTPHKAPGPLFDIALARGRNQPEGHGLSGGRPSSVQPSFILRGSDLHAEFAAGRVPVGDDAIPRTTLERLPAKNATKLGPQDVHVFVAGGGGGFGDPLRRDPDRVLADVRTGHVSPDMADAVYGVVLDGDAVDVPGTEARRRAARTLRLRDSRPVSQIMDRTLEEGEVLHPVGDTVDAVSYEGSHRFRCTECRRDLGPTDEDLKRHLLVREVSLVELSPINVHGKVDEIVLRDFCCPGCGTSVALDVQRREEPILPECSFASVDESAAAS
jgi:N-methylhydantoinase B